MILAISDLHLSGAAPKPMDLFGPQWREHDRRMAENWDAAVGEDDLVLVPGDISWAMDLGEAAPDLAWLGERPGRKLILRGNHDFWWKSVKKVRAALPPGVFALQNDAYVDEAAGVAVAGTRLWALPELAPLLDEEAALEEEVRDPVHDAKMVERELARLELSLQRLPEGDLIRVAMLHYPPTDAALRETGATRLLEKYGVALCVFGHLHHMGPSADFGGTRNGVRYRLVSCDHLGFAPARLELPRHRP